MAGEPTDLAQLIQRRELTAYEQRMARIAYAYGVDLRRSHWLDDSTVGEPMMGTVDRRWSGLVAQLQEEAFAPPGAVPDSLLGQVASLAAALRSPLPTLRILGESARLAGPWPLATPLGTTKGGMRWLLLDAQGLQRLEAPARTFVLAAALAHLQCEHAPLFTAHLMARRSKLVLGGVRGLLAPFCRVAIFSADRAGRLATGSLEEAIAGVRAQLPTEATVKWWPRFPSFEIRQQALADFEHSAIVAKMRRARAKAASGVTSDVGEDPNNTTSTTDDDTSPTRPEILVTGPMRRTPHPKAGTVLTSSTMKDAAGSLREQARRVQILAQHLGLPKLGAQAVRDVDSRLSGGPLRVAVVGEIKHGKSTLINALVKSSVVPMGVTPTTGALVFLRPDPDLPARLLEPDGPGKTLDARAFDRYARGKESTAGHVEIGVALPAGLEKVEFCDTPGINDLDQLQASVARGQLPQADVLLLVLDATQLLNRTEFSFLGEAIAAVGGLERSGARLLIAVNRIDLVSEADRPLVPQYLQKQIPHLLTGDNLFLTDAKTALASPGGTSPGVNAVNELRDTIGELSRDRGSQVPARATTLLLRQVILLEHHLAVAEHSASLDQDALEAEISHVRTLVGERQDLDDVRVLLSAGREDIVGAVRERVEEFRGNLEISALAMVQYATLKILASHLPASIHDACVAFLGQESKTIRGQLDGLTKQVLRTHSERARERLARAALRLGFRGPTVFIDPPSLALEASAVAVGVAGTAIMYFGNLMTGMAMTVAGPLATVFIREQSVRRARARARAVLPPALSDAATAIESAVIDAVDEHIAAVEEHLALADQAIGEQLLGVLEQTKARLREGDHDAWIAQLRGAGQELSDLRLALESLVARSEPAEAGAA